MVFFWCVLAATSIGFCFKLFPRWNINTLHAIVINYTTCLFIGLLLDQEISGPYLINVPNTPWFKFDLLLGFIFIIGFNLTAYSIHHFGITLSVIMQKMSLILTVTFTVLIFKEHFGWIEFAGLLMAMIAIIAINQKASPAQAKSTGLKFVILGLLLLFAAAIEILLYYVQKGNILGDHQQIFTTIGFGAAAIIGWFIIIMSVIMKRSKLHWKDFVAGVLLGLPNYFSVYLLLVMLKNGWKGSIMYPLLNVSVLLLSTLLAVFLFHEPLSRINRIGVGLAILAILIIAFAENLSLWMTSF